MWSWQREHSAGKAEKSGAERVYPIDHVSDSIFFLNNPAFLVLHMEPIESGGKLLFLCRVRKKIARDLIRAKLVERHVLIEGLDHPVAVRPNRPVPIHLVSVGVRVTREIEPVGRHPFSVTRGSEQAIDHLFVCFRGMIRNKSINFRRGGGKTNQIEGNPAKQGFLASFRRSVQAFSFESGKYEAINLVTRPIFLFCGRQFRTPGREERPMQIPFGPLIHPTLERLDLLRGERAVRIGGRHMVVGIGRHNPPNQLTFGTFSRSDHGFPIHDAKHAFFRIEPEFCFPCLFVGTMAMIAFVRENRTNIPIEVHFAILTLAARVCAPRARVSKSKNFRVSDSTILELKIWINPTLWQGLKRLSLFEVYYEALCYIGAFVFEMIRNFIQTVLHRVAAACPWLLLGSVSMSSSSVGAGFDSDFQPLIEKYCSKCHSGEKVKGGVDFSKYRDELAMQRDPKIWQTVVRQLREREMPPENKPQPTDEERQKLVAFVKRALDNIDYSTATRDPGRVLIHRLSRTEYNNTVRDLCGVDLKPANKFPSDGGGGGGFDNNADTLFVPPILLENYLSAASELIDAALTNAPDHLLAVRPGPFTTRRIAARKSIESFAQRAFRRPILESEVDALLSLYDQKAKKGGRFEDAMKAPLSAALISPHFLFRIETDQEMAGPYRVRDYELANRVSLSLSGRRCRDAWSYSEPPPLDVCTKLGFCARN